MKKTLKRLKEDASKKLNQSADFALKTVELLKEESERGKMDEKSETIMYIIELTNASIMSLTRYVQALEDYGYELDEEWDKLLDRWRKVQDQSQAVKKEEKKKPPYRV